MHPGPHGEQQAVLDGVIINGDQHALPYGQRSRLDGPQQVPTHIRVRVWTSLCTRRHEGRPASSPSKTCALWRVRFDHCPNECAGRLAVAEMRTTAAIAGAAAASHSLLCCGDAPADATSADGMGSSTSRWPTVPEDVTRLLCSS